MLRPSLALSTLIARSHAPALAHFDENVLRPFLAVVELDGRTANNLLDAIAKQSLCAFVEEDEISFQRRRRILLGYRVEEVIGRPTIELYDSEERAKDVLIEMRKRGGTASGYESVLKAKDGRSIPVLISASVLLDKDGREAGMVGFATDLRARKLEEEELRKAHDELEKQVEDQPPN